MACIAPVYLSHAHFLDAPYYGEPWWKEPEGVYLPASKEEQHKQYGAWIGVEPTTGAVMDAHKRLQINIPIGPSAYYPKVPKLLAPVCWIEETATLNEHLANQFKGQVYLAQTLRKVVIYGGYPGGIVCLIIAAAALYFRRQMAADEKFEGDDSLLANASGPGTSDAAYTQMVDDEADVDPATLRRKSFSLRDQSSA